MEFESLLSQTLALLELQLLGYFIGGLRDDIQIWVNTLTPYMLKQAMGMAVNVENDYFSKILCCH